MLKIKELPHAPQLTVFSLASLIALALAACAPAVPISRGAGKPAVEPLPTVAITPAAPIKAVEPGAVTPARASTFSEQVHPILQEKCQICHNATLKFGGWDASSYESIMATGDSGPVILPGDIQNSRLAQVLQGTDGMKMPPTGALPPDDVQVILDWIAAGADQ